MRRLLLIAAIAALCIQGCETPPKKNQERDPIPAMF